MKGGAEGGNRAPPATVRSLLSPPGIKAHATADQGKKLRKGKKRGVKCAAKRCKTDTQGVRERERKQDFKGSNLVEV